MDTNELLMRILLEQEEINRKLDLIKKREKTTNEQFLENQEYHKRNNLTFDF